MEKYDIIYKDKFWIEKWVMYSNGKELSIILRGVTFIWKCFNSLEWLIDDSKFLYTDINEINKTGSITNYCLVICLPVLISKENEELENIMKVEVCVEEEKGYSSVNISGSFSWKTILNKRIHDNFESALIEIQNQLLTKGKLKICLSCKFSQYSPYWNQSFWGLFCFKKIKKNLSKIVNKETLFKVWDIPENEKKILNTQETFSCNEHQFITLDDWNYSDWWTWTN